MFPRATSFRRRRTPHARYHFQPRQGAGALPGDRPWSDSRLTDLSPLPAQRGKGEGDNILSFRRHLRGSADYDPRKVPGIGGQVPVQRLFVTFVLSAWISSLAFAQRRRWTPMPSSWPRQRLGKLNADGKLVTPIRRPGSCVNIKYASICR